MFPGRLWGDQLGNGTRAGRPIEESWSSKVTVWGVQAPVAIITRSDRCSVPSWVMIPST